MVVFPGQFLPPVKKGDVWLNDGEGTQPRANTTFTSIDSYYGRVQSQGFHTLSYFNVFEYGENVCGNEAWNHNTLPQCRMCPDASKTHPCGQDTCSPRGCLNTTCTPSDCTPMVPSSTDAWANSSYFMHATFPDSLVTAFDTGGHGGYASPPAGTRRAIPTWQGGVVVDPADPKLKAHFLAQLERKYAKINHFEGLVVDRSDWNSLYNYDFDDGASFIHNRTAHLAQYSYLDTIGTSAIVPSRALSHTHSHTHTHTHTFIFSCPACPIVFLFSG